MRILEGTPNADHELARALLAIQHAAYAREAILIGDDRIPGLHEDVDDLRAAPLLWLTARVGQRLVGAVGWTEDGQELDVDRLVVAPDMHRRGVGSSLVATVLRRAGTRRVLVSTGRDNIPARTLYEQLNFVRIDDSEVIPGLWVSRYSWTAG